MSPPWLPALGKSTSNHCVQAQRGWQLVEEVMAGLVRVVGTVGVGVMVVVPSVGGGEVLEVTAVLVGVGGTVVVGLTVVVSSLGGREVWEVTAVLAGEVGAAVVGLMVVVPSVGGAEVLGTTVVPAVVVHFDSGRVEVVVVGAGVSVAEVEVSAGEGVVGSLVVVPGGATVVSHCCWSQQYSLSR